MALFVLIEPAKTVRMYWLGSVETVTRLTCLRPDSNAIPSKPYPALDPWVTLYMLLFPPMEVRVKNSTEL